MKKALKPSLEITDVNLLKLSSIVLGSLFNNPYYQNPTPALPLVQAAFDTYKVSMGQSFKGSAQQKAQKDADKQVLLMMVRKLSDYVNGIAEGDLVKLATCGFPLSKDRQPVILGTAKPKVEYGVISGQMISSTPAVHGAVSYKHQYTTNPSEELWQEVTTTRAKCILKNLVPGQVYNYRIVVIGTSGQVTVSEVIIKMAV